MLYAIGCPSWWKKRFYDKFGDEESVIHPAVISPMHGLDNAEFSSVSGFDQEIIQNLSLSPCCLLSVGES